MTPSTETGVESPGSPKGIKEPRAAPRGTSGWGRGTCRACPATEIRVMGLLGTRLIYSPTKAAPKVCARAES